MVATATMEKPQEKVETRPAPIVIPQEAVRRFEVPDLDYHAPWLLPRLLAKFPHLNERQMVGFLRAMAYSNEHYFMFYEHGVGLFQVMGGHTLAGDNIVWERFVWARDPDNPLHIAGCAEMYDRVAKWAKQKGITKMHVEESTDVPTELIKKRFERVIEVVQRVVRL